MEHYKRGNLGSFMSGMLAAVAVGGYLLFGSRNAKKNRQKVEDWVEDTKADVTAKLRKMKRVSRDKYNEVVESFSKAKDEADEDE